MAGDLWPGGDYYQIWRVSDGSKLTDLRPLAAEPGSAAFLGDGTHFARGLWDGHVEVTTFLDHRIVSQRRPHTGWVRALVAAPDRKTFATASADRSILLWDAATYVPLARRRGHIGEITSIAYSPDGQEIASGSYDGTVKIWSADPREAVPQLQGPATVAGFADANRGIVLFRTNELSVWTPETGELRRFPVPLGRIPISEGNWGRPARVHPDMSIVARGRKDGKVEVWRLNDGLMISEWQAHTQGIASAIFSPDGKRLMTADGAGEIRIWDWNLRREISHLEPVGGFYLAAYSPDGRYLACAAAEQGLWLHDLEHDTRRQVQRVVEGDHVMAVAFSPDGKTLAASRMSQAQVHLWDVPSGQERVILRGHVQGMNSIAISPDGKTLATASTDRTVKLWSLVTQEELATIPVPQGIPVVDFSMDGRMLAISDLSAIGRGTMVLLAPTFEEIAERERAEASQP